MAIIKKTSAFIALFLVFIMLFSVVSIPCNQHFSNYSLIGTKEVNVDSLGDNETESSIINIDVKVQKIEDPNVKNGSWVDEIGVFVGDIVRFKITVTNLGYHDLVYVRIIDQLPLSDILEYINGSATIDNESKEPVLMADGRIFWIFEELFSGEEKSIVFSMVALKETLVEGAFNYAFVTARLNQKYEDAIHVLEVELANATTRVQQIVYDINLEKENLLDLNDELIDLSDNETSLKFEIDGIKEKITGLQEVELSIKKAISDIDVEITVLNDNKARYEQELIVIQAQIDEEQKQLNGQINIVLGLKEELGIHQENLAVLYNTLNGTLSEQYDQNGTIATTIHNIEVEEGIIAKIKQDIGSAENDLSKTSQTIVNLNNDANDLAVSIAPLEEQQASLLYKKTILNEEHEKIASYIQTLEDDLVNNYAKQLKIQNDIAIKQNETRGILATLGDLAIRKDEIAAKILSIGKNLEYYDGLKADIEAKKASNDAQLDQILLDIKAVDEQLTANSAEILSTENIRQAQAEKILDSQKILSKYQEDLLNLNNALNDALQAHSQNDGTISSLLGQIEDYKGKIDSISSRIDSLQKDIDSTVVKINELNVSEKQYSDQLDALDAEKNARMGEQQLLQADYDKIVMDIQALINNIANENIVKLEIQNNMDQKLNLKQTTLGEIESLKQIAVIISKEITSIEKEITDYNRLKTYYKTQMNNNDSIIAQLTLDISLKNDEYNLISKDILYYESLRTAQESNIADLQTTLALQQESLATLYAEYDESLKTYNDHDGTITATQAKIQNQLSLIEATKQDIKVAEELLSSTIETLTVLTYNQQQILEAIGLLDEDIDKKVLERDETEVLILNQQDILNSLNGEILATKAQLLDVQNELFTNRLLLDSANAAIDQFYLQNAALTESIATTADSININTLDKDALEVQKANLVAEIDAITLDTNDKKMRQQAVHSEIIEKQQMKSDTEQYIASRQADLTLHQNTLDALYLDLDAALNSQQINNGTITTLQNLIAEQKDNIHKTEISIALAEGELDTIIKDIKNLENLRDQIALDVTATSEQINIKTTEGDLLRTDHNNTVISIAAKEQEKLGILSQIQNEQNNLFVLTDNCDGKGLELQVITEDIGENNSLLEAVAQEEMQLVSDRNAEKQKLVIIEKEFDGLLVNPIGNDAEIIALQVGKGNTELKIAQITREIGNCEYQLQETMVVLDGLITSKNQVEQKLNLIAGDIAAKEQMISDLESSKNDTEVEILLLQQHKALLDDQINANEADVLSLQALKASQEQEYDNYAAQVNDTIILKAEKEKDIAQLNELLATQQNKLAGHYNDLNAVVLAQQDKDGSISAILESISLEEASTALISDNILKVQSDLTGIKLTLQSLTDEETLLLKQISDQEDLLSSKILSETDTEQKRLEKDSLISSLLNDKASYEADLAYVQGQIQIQQGVASDLGVKISLFEYQETSLNNKILDLEGQKTIEASKEDAYEQSFSTLISDIDVLSNEKMIKIDEYNVAHAQVLEKIDMKQTQESSLDSLKTQLVDQQQTLDVYYDNLNAALQAQNSNDGSLKEIQDKIKTQKDGIIDTKQKITAAESTLNTNIQTLSNLIETGKQLQSSIIVLEGQKATAELEKLASLVRYNDTIDKIKLSEADLSAKAAEHLQVQSSISDKQSLIPSIDADVDAINKQLSDINDLITGYETDLANKKQSKADLEVSLIDKDAAINQILLDINNAIDQQKIVSDELSKCESLEQMQKEELIGLQTTQNQYQGGLAVVNNEYNAALLVRTNIENTIFDLRTDIDNVDGKIESTKTDITIAETALNNAEQTLFTLRENEKQLQDTRTILEGQKTKNALDKEMLVNQYNNADAETQALNNNLSISNDDYKKILGDISVYKDTLTAVENDLQQLDDALLIVDGAIDSNQEDIKNEKPLFADNEAKIISNDAQLYQINIDINNLILQQQQIARDILASETVKETQASILNGLLTDLNQHDENLAKLNADLQKEFDTQQINNGYISDLLKQIEDTKTIIAQTIDKVIMEESKQTTISNGIDLLDNQKMLTVQQIDTTIESINDKQLVKTGYETDLQNIVEQKTDFETLQLKKENELSSVQSQQIGVKQAIDVVTNTINSLESEKIQLDQFIIDISDLIKIRKIAIFNLFLRDQDFAIVHVFNLSTAPSISIDKKVWDTSTGQWVDEITVGLNEKLRFNITVKNTGNTDLQKITIRDSLPFEILEYADNAHPEPEISNNELYWNESQLPMGGSIFIEFDADAIASGTGVNKAEVFASNITIKRYPKEDIVDSKDTITPDSIKVYPAYEVANIVDDQIEYTPNPDFADSDSLTYKIFDNKSVNDTATVYLTIININNPPVAIDDEFSTSENTPSDFDVITNDYDIDGDQIILNSIKSDPNNGIASIISGKIRYEPNTGFVGLDSLEYEIQDGNGGNDTAILTITVNNINGPPVANDDKITVYYNSSDNVIDVIANDNDPDGDSLIIDSIVYYPPTNGTVTINETQKSIIYTPNPWFIGKDYFGYVITDGKGGYDSASVTVNVVKNISGIIVKPMEGYLYLRNHLRLRNYGALNITKLLQFMDVDALIIGPINIKVEINDSDFVASKVEFYIDDVLKNTTSEVSYNWTFNERFFKICTIKAVAYGTIFNKESTIIDEIDVLILNFGLCKGAIGGNGRLIFR